MMISNLYFVYHWADGRRIKLDSGMLDLCSLVVSVGKAMNRVWDGRMRVRRPSLNFVCMCVQQSTNFPQVSLKAALCLYGPNQSVASLLYV